MKPLRIIALLFAARIGYPQELQPRAYLPAPVGLRFTSFSYANNRGGLLFDPSLPIEDGRAHANGGSIGIGGTLGVLGRSAQVLAVIPYMAANLTGKLSGVETSRYRSGLADATLRYSMNIYGARVMQPEEFVKQRPKFVVGASLTATAPIGQYDPNVLINVGANRWAFKPEIGAMRVAGKWAFEGAVGAWLYTKNSNFNNGAVRTQAPLGSVQLHVVRLLPRRMWTAFDTTFYFGGRTTVNGRLNADLIGNSRLGATFGIALSRRHALRFAYFTGATTRVGADITSLSVSYQVFWQKDRR